MTPLHRESIWLALDADLVRDLEALARIRGVTKHDVASLALKPGIEAMRASPKVPR